MRFSHFPDYRASRTPPEFFGTDFPSEIRYACDFVNFTGQARMTRFFVSCCSPITITLIPMTRDVVLLFLSCLGIAIDPDDILPSQALIQGQFSVLYRPDHDGTVFHSV
ncbi:MAG: hypothetical protein H8E00_00075 [Deltaproteobacteria bacterium]|nr:hypothetical protein [Deltaproteobacteria bacterium]